MKFENKYPNANSIDRFEFEYSHVTKTPKLGQCKRCGAFTKWHDIIFQQHACSEECLSIMWKQYKNDQKGDDLRQSQLHFEKVKEELKIIENARDVWKDIVIVVYNQLDYLKQCIESINKNTKFYNLYIWDNGSSKETKDYIEELMLKGLGAEDWSVTSMRSELNVGFIEPNNELVGWGTSEYIVLLNSDTKVFEGWDKVMTGFLDENNDVAQVGFWGGHLGPDGKGFGGTNGFYIDYVPGWCFCISRKTYEKFGLFNKELKFAYCEDADLSLRLKESGKRIYALYSSLVHHYQNKTIIEVDKEGQIDIKSSFDSNHIYLKQRWANYLANDRILLKKDKHGQA